MSKKWTKEEIETHIRTNVEDYGAVIVVGALFKKFYGEYPKVGLSGFQAQGIDSLVEVLPDIPVKEAMQVVTKEIKEDEGYRTGWQANIAMAFKDKYEHYDGSETVHKVANEAADDFLNLLCT